MRTILVAVFLLLFTPFLAVAQDLIFSAHEAIQHRDYDRAIALLELALRENPQSADLQYYLGLALKGKNHNDEALSRVLTVIDLKPKYADAYYEIGLIYLGQGRSQEAETMFQKGLSLSKNDGRFFYGLGLSDMSRDSLSSATVWMIKAVEADPNNPLFCRGRGDVYARKKVSELAIQDYKRALFLDSTLVDVRYNLGKLYAQNRRYTDAVSELRKAVDIDSTFLLAYNDLSEIYYKAKRYNDAAFYLMKSVSFKPDDPTTNLLLSKALYLGGSGKEAVPYLEKAAALNPHDSEIHTFLGEALVKQKDHEKAALAYTHAIEQSPDDNTLRHKLARIHLSMGDTTTAISDLRQIVTLDSAATDAVVSLGNLLYQTGHYGEAIPYLKQRLEDDPGAVQTYLDLGRCYLRIGQPDSLRGLLETLDKVVGQHPDLSSVYFDLGIDLFKEKHYDLAIPFLVKKTKINPTHWATHINLGLVYIAKGNYPKAADALRHAAHLKPDDAKTHLWLAQVYGQMNDIAAAKNAYQKVVTLDRDNQEAYRQIGYYLLLEKRYDEAVVSLQKAIRLKPSDPQAHLWLAQGLARSGQAEKAKGEYHEVLKLDRNNEDAKRGLKLLEGG